MSSGASNSWGKKFNDRIETVNLDAAVIFTPIALLLVILIAGFDPVMFAAIGLTFLVLLPLWLPFLILHHLWASWIHYIRFKYWKSLDQVLLEITIPQEMSKSPLAMEVFLAAIWNAGGETTFIDRMWLGKFRAVFTLEIASNEGRVAFYIHLRRAFKNIVESRLYGQFPELHVREVEDYVTKIPFNNKDYTLFGSEYKSANPTGPNVYPIKTYVDFGLEKDPKEEFRVDPITHTLELLGSVGKDEYYWVQIIMVARKKDQWYGFYKKADELKVEADAEIQRIMTESAKRAKKIIEGNDISEGKMTLLTDGEKRKIEAIENKIAKLIFECGLRTVYLAKKARFNGINSGGIIRFFDHVKSNEFNGLGAARGMSIYDYPWQDFRNIRVNRTRMNLFTRYRDRAYFYAPFDQSPVFLNTEEVATLWHFPGSVVQTPSLGRKLSRTSEAPPNLPM